MSAPGTPKASQAAITAVQEALGCWLVSEYGADYRCGLCGVAWTERGCPVAAADAAAPHNAAQALRDAASGVALALVNEVGSGHTSTYSVRRWLHELADRIEAGQ